MPRYVAWRWEIGFAALPTVARLVVSSIIHPPPDYWLFFFEVMGGVEIYVFSFILYCATFLEFIERDSFSIRKEPHANIFSGLLIGVVGTAVLMVVSAASTPSIWLVLFAVLIAFRTVNYC